MKIRQVTTGDVTKLYHMMNVLDDETDYMLYEPGERKLRSKSYERLAETVESAAAGADFLTVAENDKGEIVGYVWAERGKLNRIRHTAYVVIGVLRDYRGQGIGTKLLAELDCWAKLNDLVRLELTVEAPNAGAKRLYEKNGFAVEGMRSRSMLVNGKYVDEYYMAKIIN